MDDNTPATQAVPNGTPGDDKPVQDAPARTGLTDETVGTDPTEVTDTTAVRDETAATDPTVVTERPAVTDPTLVTERPAVTDKPVESSATRPARPKGPNASAIVLGLIAMVIAGLIIVSETQDLTIDWSGKGPGLIVGVGALLVVLGAIGLVRRHEDG